MSEWLDDIRRIRAVKLASEDRAHLSGTGVSFERFERPGEYCMIPWIRISTPYSAQGAGPSSPRILEAPLAQVQMIEFAPSP